MSRTPPHIALAVATLAFVVSIVIALAAVGAADAKPAGPAAAHAARLAHESPRHTLGTAVAGRDPLTGDAPWYRAVA